MSSEPTKRAEAPHSLSVALRVLSSMVAVLAVFGSLGHPVAVAAAAPVVGFGVWAAERATRARLRSSVVLGSAGGLALGSLIFAHVLQSWEWPSHVLGVRGVVGLALFIQLAGLGAALLGALRWSARRHRVFVGLEMLVFLIGIASLVAAHRHGQVLRPLWLSDWAWRRGIDPQLVLTAMGVGSFAVWLSVLLADARGRLRWAFVPLVALLLGLPFLVPESDDRTETDLASELGLTLETDGDRLPTDEGPAKDGDGSDGDRGEGGGGGQEEGESGEGGGSEGGDEEGEGGSDGGEETSEEGGGGSAADDLDTQQSPTGPNPEPQPRAVVLLGDDFEPPSGGFYFRQDAWSRRQGARLVPATSSTVDRDLVRHFPMLRDVPRATPPMSRRQPVNATVGILTTSAAPFALESALAFEPRPNPNPSRFAHFYAFEAAPVIADYVEFFGASFGDPAWTDEERAYYLEGPEDPRYHELIAEILEPIPKSSRNDLWAQAVAVKLWMDSEIIYSLRHRHAGARDPTADFLFGDRTGYCVHIAHAVVYLYRLMGIPSRIGVGYMVPAEGRHGSTVVIMESDAHAWPEIHIDGVGWVVLDVSPEQVVGNGPPIAEPDLADLLADMAREVPEYETVQEQMEAAPRWTLSQILAALLRSLVWVSLLGVYAWKLWRRNAWRFVAADRRALAAWEAALDQTFEAGRGREWGESVHAWARREAGTLPSLGRIADAVTERRYAARPSPRTTDLRAFAALHRTLDRELAATTPLWRRALGALDPTSPFRLR